MSYIVYTSDDLKESLSEIYDKLDNVSSYIDDAMSSVDYMENDYDYYHGREFYEDLHFKDDIADVVNMVKQIDEQIIEFKKMWNEKMQILKDSSEDRFKDQYKDAIIEVNESEKHDEIKHIHEREMESIIDSYDKTLGKYEAENQILKDGIKALLKYVSIEMDHYISEDGQDEYDFFSFYHNGNNCEDADYSLGDKDGFTKIKAMLEVIEDEKHA